MEGVRPLMVVAVVLALAMSTIAVPARAALVGTEQLLASSGQSDARERVDVFLARDEVRQQLQAWGVAPAHAQARIAALSEDEVVMLAERIDEMPAGAGVLEVVGIVFVVLLILELVGVTNIFNAI